MRQYSMFPAFVQFCKTGIAFRTGGTAPAQAIDNTGSSDMLLETVRKNGDSMKKFSICLLFPAVCAFSTEHASAQSAIEMSYCTETELSARGSAYRLFENAEEWELQYPSGDELRGMLSHKIEEPFKSRYFSLYKNKNGTEYMRFSLDAGDKGKSTHGSSVRAELRHRNEWTLDGKNALSYTFYATSTDFGTARFTVGQFLQHCTKKDSPLCRIELWNGKIEAVVNNYGPDGTTKSDGKTHRYSLGAIRQGEEISLRIESAAGVLRLFRDGELKAEHTFPQAVSRTQKNYFKAGIYYQNKDSPRIFSEVFMRNLRTDIGG